MPMRGVLGSDYMRIRDDFGEITNPFDSAERLAVVPAITPDVAIFHAYQSDRNGNIMADTAQNNKLLAQATRRAVIVTVEELVDELTWNPRRMYIPGNLITAVVYAPGGAHPTSCRGFYPVDSQHIQEYLSCSADTKKWQAYLEKYIYDVQDQHAYCELVEMERLWEEVKR